MRILKDVLILVGPSGCGKSTLLKLLQADLPGRFGYSISHTTRAPRTGEVNGQHYHFIQPEEFNQMVAEGKFLEHALVHNTMYGTSFQSLADVAAEGKVAAADLDVVGAQSIRKCPTLKSCIVFIQTPSEAILEQRLRSRNTESEEKIQIRLETAQREMAWFEANRDFFDIELMNDKIDVCYAKFRKEVGRIVFGEEDEKQEEQQQVNDASISSPLSAQSDKTTPHHPSPAETIAAETLTNSGSGGSTAAAATAESGSPSSSSPSIEEQKVLSQAQHAAQQQQQAEDDGVSRDILAGADEEAPSRRPRQ